MAVVFFDGFERGIDTYYWTATGTSASSSSVSIATSDPVTNNIKLKNIGTQSSKKLYLGFRMSYFVVRNNQPFVVFYDASNTEVLRLTWNTAAGIDGIGINVVKNGSTVATYAVLNSIANAVFYSDSTTFFLFSGNRVLEFEIDLNNDTIAMRYEGQAIATTTAATLTSGLSIGNDISSLAVFGSVGSYNANLVDIYLVDNDGTFANTWLGNNFQIHSPSFSSAPKVFGAWDNPSGNAGSVLNSNDSDSSYIRTASTAAYELYNLNDISPSGFSPVVAGLRVASVSRTGGLPAAYKYAYRNQSTLTNYEMGAKMTVTQTNYTAQTSQFINVNPETAAQWTVAQVNAGAFGVRSVEP